MALRAIPAIALAFCINAHAQQSWNETTVGARYASDFYFPGSDAKVAQKIATLNTTGGFQYGGYMFNVDYLISDSNNPEANGNAGAREIYSVSRVNWSAAKILGTQFDNGIVRDVGLMTGFDLNTKNDAYAAAGRTWMIGPSVQLAVPRGYWSVTAGLSKETNHNGIVHADVHYDTAWRAETSWMTPFAIGPAPVVFKGFVTVTGPKGLDGFHVQTKTETLARASLMFDVGALMGKPHSFYLGPGYEYWKNMFGTPATEAPGTKRSAATLNAEFHF
jgi:hypothetical protein